MYSIFLAQFLLAVTCSDYGSWEFISLSLGQKTLKQTGPPNIHVPCVIQPILRGEF